MYISSHFCWFLLTAPRGNLKLSVTQLQCPAKEATFETFWNYPVPGAMIFSTSEIDGHLHGKYGRFYRANCVFAADSLDSFGFVGFWDGLGSSSLPTWRGSEQKKQDCMTLHDELLTHQPWNWQCSFKWCSMVNMTNVYQREFVSKASWHDHPWQAEFILHSGTGLSNALTTDLWIDGTMW